MTKPILYLDVDDTLLCFAHGKPPRPAPCIPEFLAWAEEHFAVRWLTSWAVAGTMLPEHITELSGVLNIPETQLASYNHNRGWVNLKTEAIDFEVPWVWVEDSMLYKEELLLNERGMATRFYRTNVSHNATALQVTWRRLSKNLGLPGAPSPPWKTK